MSVRRKLLGAAPPAAEQEPVAVPEGDGDREWLRAVRGPTLITDPPRCFECYLEAGAGAERTDGGTGLFGSDPGETPVDLTQDKDTSQAVADDAVEQARRVVRQPCSAATDYRAWSP